MVAAGKITKLFGNNGQLAVVLYDAFPEQINMEEPLYIEVDMLTVPLFLESFELRGRSGAIVGFADFDTDRRASELIGKELFVKDEDEGESDQTEQMSLTDMIGYKVTVKRSKLEGEITDCFDNDLNPLFEIDFGGTRVLVPAVEEMTVSINHRKRTVRFDLPEGLIELYTEPSDKPSDK